VNMYRTDEGQVGLPFAIYPSAFLYNKRLFSRAGLNAPPSRYNEPYRMPDGSTAQWNWDTIAQVARLLTLDASGKNATQPGFNRNRIVQYGFLWQWQAHPNYIGSYWSSGSMLASGNSRGNYRAQAPEAWVAAWKWTYDGIWGPQPFMPNIDVEGSADFGSGNPFNSGKIAMTELPIWYTCCINDVAPWAEFAALPIYNGQVAGRMDSDTFRLWKGTKYPVQAFTVLQYLVGEGVQKLNIGTPALPPAYGALPARVEDQGPYFDAKRAQFPNVRNWNIFVENLQYPDAPNAEAWMPNYTDAWARGTDFANLFRSDGRLDMDSEIKNYVNDLTLIFNR
jgi:multiple sugar transport system substrate-binding protein